MLARQRIIPLHSRQAAVSFPFLSFSTPISVWPLDALCGAGYHPTVMNKQALIDELHTSRAELLDALDGLSPEQMLLPNAVGDWSVRDVLSHLVDWEAELITALNQIQNKKYPAIMDIDNIDGWNEKQHFEHAQRPLESILEDFEGVHRMLLRILSDFPEKALIDNRRFSWMEGEPLAYLIEETAILHEREHADDIRIWREQNDL